MLRILLHVATVAAWASGCRTADRAVPPANAGPAANVPTAAGGEKSVQYVTKLLRESIHDEQNMIRRSDATNHQSLAKFMGRDFWRSHYPLTYAGGKILNEGRAALPPLLSIANDRASTHEVRAAAWQTIGDLNGYDEPGMFDALLKAHRDGRLELDALYWAVRRALPIDNWSDVPPMGQSGIVAWLETETRTSTYEQIILRLLDEQMKPERFSIPSRYRFFRRFLNRVDDRDVDEWLQDRSPAAYRFRQKMLARGSDPADGLVDYLADFLTWGDELDKAVGAIFPDPEDQRACRELVEVIYGSKSEGLGPILGGWEDRLRAWYRANRPWMHYDPMRHRIVVSQPKRSPGGEPDAPQGGRPGGAGG